MLLLAILAMLPLAAVAQAAPTKPHIVFMLADGEPPAAAPELAAGRSATPPIATSPPPPTVEPSSLPAYSAS